MKLTHLAAAAALAIGSASSFAAVLTPLDLSSGSGFFGNTPTPAGGFVDTITFTLSTPSIFNGSVVSVPNGTQDIDFTFIGLTGPSGVFSFTQFLGDQQGVEVWGSPTAGWSLAAGNYQITLVGTNSASIASYGANVAVTAVPEPGSLALFLAGGGALGFLARRRRV